MSDWPPMGSAMDLPDGELRHGSTGQLFEVRKGHWVMLPSNDVYEALRLRELATCATPRNEIERVAQIVLSVFHYNDGLETLDWQIARAVLAALDLCPEDGSITALRNRADANGESCGHFLRALESIRDNTTDHAIYQIAVDAIRMSWLKEKDIAP
jgi:hypothetical protein